MPEPAIDLVIDLDAHAHRLKVRLRVAMTAADEAVQRLGLPDSFTVRSVAGAAALWLGPDQWLMVSEQTSAADLIAHIADRLEVLTHHAADTSAALACARLSGRRVRELLAMGSALDWTIVAPGECRRTQFARIPVIAHAVEKQRFELYYDRSYRQYLDRWFAHASSDPLLQAPIKATHARSKP